MLVNVPGPQRQVPIWRLHLSTASELVFLLLYRKIMNLLLCLGGEWAWLLFYSIRAVSIRRYGRNVKTSCQQIVPMFGVPWMAFLLLILLYFSWALILCSRPLSIYISFFDAEAHYFTVMREEECCKNFCVCFLFGILSSSSYIAREVLILWFNSVSSSVFWEWKGIIIGTLTSARCQRNQRNLDLACHGYGTNLLHIGIKCIVFKVFSMCF